MSHNAFSRISRRTFGAGALGTIAAAMTASKSFAQATPGAQASPVSDEPYLVLRIESVGGLRPMETMFLDTPMISVYSDGTVIQPAIVTAIYPPVAITPLNTFTISQSAIAEVIARATAVGLDEPRVITNSLVMDAGTAQISLEVRGSKVVSSIYALHVNGPQPPEWDEATAELFAGIQEFTGWVNSLAIGLDPSDIVTREAPYEVERLQVIAFIPDSANPLPTGVPDLTFPELIWPLETSLAELGAVYEPFPNTGMPPMRCAELSDEDAASVIAVAGEGNLVSPWNDGGLTYGILFNPILPGDPSCVTFPS